MRPRSLHAERDLVADLSAMSREIVVAHKRHEPENAWLERRTRIADLPSARMAYEKGASSDSVLNARSAAQVALEQIAAVRQRIGSEAQLSLAFLRHTGLRL